MSVDKHKSHTTSLAPLKERRTFGRRTTFQPARIVVDGKSPLSCFVVDISEGGARIRLVEPADDLIAFTLEIESQGISLSCMVVHRQPNQIGVRFMRMPRQLSRTGHHSSKRLKELVDALAANGHVPR